MKRIALIVSLMFLLIGQAQAESGDQYYLVNLGYTQKDISEKPDPLILASLSYGYGLTQKWAVEVDYAQSISGGGLTKEITPTESVDGDYSVWFMTLGAAYRHIFLDTFYFKGKAGFTFGEDELKFNDNTAVDNDKKSIEAFSGGLGVGYLAGDVIGSSVTVEAGLVMHSQDLMSLMIGANATF